MNSDLIINLDSSFMNLDLIINLNFIINFNSMFINLSSLFINLDLSFMEFINLGFFENFTYFKHPIAIN